MDYWDKCEQLSNEGEVGRAIVAIAEDIRGRKGIGDELEAIDDDTVAEMLDGWVDIVRRIASTGLM